MDLKKYYPQMIQTIQNAVKIKTVLDKPVLGGPFGQGNKDCLEYVLSVAKELGFRTVNLDGYCGYAEVGEGDELVGIVGHLDVVPEGDGWKYPPYSGALAEDAIWGRGTLDDKGPAIISLYAIKALMDDGFKFDKRVRVIFGCNEETGSLCMEHYLKVDEPISYGVSPDSEFPVIFAEKTINSIEIKGESSLGDGVKLVRLDGGIVINAVPDVCTLTLDTNGENAQEVAAKICAALEKNAIANEHTISGQTLTFTVHGKAAHGSIPQCGVNAISYAIDALNGVVNCDFVRIYNEYISTCVHGEKLGCFAEDEYGKIAVNVGLCHFEDGKFSIKINSRLPFSTDTNTMLNGVKSTLKNEICAKVTLLSESVGFKIDPDSDMIQVLTNAYKDVTGDKSAKPICTPGGTYAREFQNCVAFGPEMQGFGEMIIHQPNERLTLKAMEAIFAIYVKAYADLISKVSFK
nr:MAG TPA: hypothetical protein [Caudoviricetes sp.]